MLVAAVVLGILGMHELRTVGDPRHGSVSDPLPVMAPTSLPEPDATSAAGEVTHWATHLADVCVALLVAGMGVVGLRLLGRRLTNRTTSVASPVIATPVRRRARSSPARSRSHLELGVLLH